MKRLLWLLPVLLLCSFSEPEKVNWQEWNQAQALAGSQDKPMMVFVYAKWCHMCKRMDAKVFTDDEVAALLNEHFIPVKLDAEFSGELKINGDSYTPLELLAKLTENQFRGIPAYLFISGNPGEKPRLEAGLRDPLEMKVLLEEFL